MYHNSQNITGPELSTKSAKAGNQDQRVLDWFKKYNGSYCAGEVYLYSGIFDNTKPHQLNSARRAISNLTKSGELQKTGDRVKCPATGENVFSWRLATNQTTLF